MRVLIGLVGPPLAGKETVAEFIAHIASEKGLAFGHHRSRGILEATLKLWHKEVNRPNMQKLLRVMEAPGAFGEGSLSGAIRQRLAGNEADIVIYDAVRLPSDETMMRDLDGLILAITADEKTRYNRAKQRRREGEAELTIEQFQVEDTASTEIHIPNIASRADWTIDNNGNADDLRLEVKKFWIEKIDPLLTARK
ncbi:MAG: hypothetical protein HY434_00130 [Candidatus Liptonbacteria bacterium]|nr:hypothetical protein [Candidatus Liptonbacteria bacterium]